MHPLPLHLASASPRRLQLLRAVGLDPLPLAADVEESRAAGESPAAMVRRLAEAKGRAVASILAGRGSSGLLLAADTAVTLDGSVLGKPVDRDDAGRMLRRLRGRTHEVLTGVFLLDLTNDRSFDETRSTRVRFRELDDPTIEAYVATGEPLDKAGAYGIQERGALLVDSIEGSWSNVVGLPVERLPVWLAALGIDPGAVLDWRDPGA